MPVDGSEIAGGPDAVTPRPPVSLRAAGLLTGTEGLVALVVAVVLALRELRGVGDGVVSGYGIGLWFALVGGGVLASGAALFRGRRGGRAPAVVVQLVLAPVVYSLVTDSEWPWLGVVLGLFVVAVLVTLFLPPSQAWMRERFAAEHPPTPAPGPPLSAREERSRRGKPTRPR